MSDAETSSPPASELEKPSAASASTPPVREELVTTHHVVSTPAGELRYTAKAGRVVLYRDKEEDGVWKGRVPHAQVGVVAYTLDDTDPATRPVTFSFNGGPGSSSVWLHLGLFGPRRVDMGDVGALAPPPGGLLDNAETLLAESDLVFVDPVGTGRSRVVDGEKEADFHGFTADVESVGEVIRQWVTAEGRWLSPKLLAGESYGTTRAAALAQHLQGTGMYLSGVVLVSVVMNFGILFVTPGDDRPYPRYLPFYAAAAHRHGKHPGRELADVVAEAEAYAAREYPYVLAQGSRLGAEERADAVATVARLAGLSEAYVERADLRVEHLRYFAELLREEGLVVGRLDARFTGPAGDGTAASLEADPSMDAVLGPYTAAHAHHLRAELGVQDATPFSVFSRRAIERWSYKEFENASVSVLDRLSRAMRQNPHLKVYVGLGRYDGATPFSSAEDDLAHLDVPRSRRDDVELRYYEAGHMMYVHEPSRVQQSADIADFVRRATARPDAG
ncbi:S10 family peptidase [Pseudokineococcus sp. 1T1Z-3]|uniref:S10 family peptidase n=1 Tax=Pseudokineococcus sp. 1T1Z-3 TaxID=3132745 RepID=UPI0030B177B7